MKEYHSAMNFSHTAEPNNIRRGSGESHNLRSTSRCNTPRPQGRNNINVNVRTS